MGIALGLDHFVSVLGNISVVEDSHFDVLIDTVASKAQHNSYIIDRLSFASKHPYRPVLQRLTHVHRNAIAMRSCT